MLPRLRLMPREERFFDLFVEDAVNVLAAARELETMLANYDDAEQHAKQLFALEHHGDELTHAIGHKLNTSFVTPFDREDIVALISGLDDILDLVEEVADTFILYRIDAPTKEARDQVRIIVRQCEQLLEALRQLNRFEGLDQHWIEIHRLENEGDRIARAAVANLFSQASPVEIIKWKDVYGLLESCIDMCEDVANTIERITIKHA